MDDRFDTIYRKLFVVGGSQELGECRKRLCYYERYTPNDMQEVSLVGYSKRTEYDGDKDYWRKAALNWRYDKNDTDEARIL